MALFGRCECQNRKEKYVFFKSPPTATVFAIDSSTLNIEPVKHEYSIKRGLNPYVKIEHVFVFPSNTGIFCIEA